jgi:F0F1-type ATP synthase assembly protein I
MDKNGQQPDSEPGASANSYAKYTGIAFQMLAIIGLFAFIGYELDKYFKNQTQWITALSCVIGVCLSIFQTIRQLRK